MTLRADLENIVKWIKPGSRVLDLGCGDGTLLSYLNRELDVTGYGIEIDPDNIAKCIRAGINVIETDLDAGLSDFDDDSFDHVILTQTLQAVHYPNRLIEEMLRVGREGIVTFPNFGHWKTRFQLMVGGRMPVTRSLPSNWYDTPNIHLCTLKDFEDLCDNLQVSILEREVVDYSHRSGSGMRLVPNLLAEIALYRFKRH